MTALLFYVVLVDIGLERLMFVAALTKKDHVLPLSTQAICTLGYAS